MFIASRAQALGAIGRLKAIVERLAYVPRKTAELAVPRINRLIQTEFRHGEDPYGRPWAALKPATLAKGRRPPPLTETRELRATTLAKTNPGGRAGITITLGASYGYFHQVGFRNGRTRVKPRRILPQQGLPAAWKAALDLSAREAARAATRGA